METTTQKSAAAIVASKTNNAIGSQSVSKSVKRTAVLAEKVYVSERQKAGTMSVQLRQEVTTISSYPSARPNNPLTGNLFDLRDYGFSNQDHANTEKRVAWLNVPVGTTLEQVQAKLAALGSQACLYKILDNQPILSSDQEYAISIGQRSLDEYANAQVIRYPENHAQAGQIVKDPNGKVQYRAVFFSNCGLEDQDGRRSADDYGYISPEIAAELAGTPMNATIIPSQGLGE